MRREIVRWLVLGVGLLLCLGAAASGQEEDAAAEDIGRRVLEEVAGQEGLADEEQLAARFREALLKELGPDHPLVLTLRANAAFELYEQGDYAGAQAAFEELLPTLRRVQGEEHPDTLTVMNNLAQTLKKQGDFTGARKLEKEVLSTLRPVLGEGHPVTLTVMNNLIQTLKKQRDFTGARALEEEILWIVRRVLDEDDPDTLTAMAHLGGTLYEGGDFTGAREIFEMVSSSRRRLLGEDHPDTLKAMGNLASTLKKLGAFASARELEEEVLSTVRRVLGENHPNTLTPRANLASTLHEQGDLTRARELEEEVLSSRRRLLGEDHPDTLTAMANLASTLKRQEDFADARELEEEVLSRRRRVLGENHPDTLAAMANLGSTLYEQGDLTQARAVFEEVLSRRRRVLGDKHPDTLGASHNLAGVLYSQHDLAGARRLYEEVLEIRGAILGPDHRPSTIAEIFTLEGLAVIYRDSQELEKAGRLFLETLDAVEAQTGRAGDSEDIRSTFKAQLDDIYPTALRTFLDLGRPNEALHILERFRAQSFLRMLSRKDLLRFELPPDLAARRRNLALRYDQSLRQLDRFLIAQDQDGIAAVRKKQRELHRERERIQAEIRRISPRLADLEDPRPLTAEEIRQTLEPGTLMLSYSVSSDRTDLFVLSGEGKLDSHRLPIGGQELWGQIGCFYGQLQGSSKDFGASRNAMGKWLYDRLIPPAVAERIAQSKRLLIIPDGPLHYLPFAALVRATDDGKEQYLVEWKPVHTALSATVHAHLRKDRPAARPADGPRPLQLAAFGNPSYPGADDGNRRLALVRDAVDRGLFDGLLPLPHSGREVTTIGGLYPQEAARTWVGPDATEERAKALGKDVRIVHFALHGVADPQNPLDSFLAFAIPDQPAEGRDNGLLQAWEIFERVRLDADLVVLSACQTALGPQRGGEGLMSLSRAFQYAGARTVAASLWSVNDASTAELMIRFYGHLKDGKPKDEALRAAQVELIRGGPIEVVDENGDLKEEDYSAPYHWAAFQLIGDWQ